MLPALCCLLILIFLTTFSCPANASVKISLSLDRDEAAVGDSVQLSVNVEGAGGEKPQIAGLENFEVRDAGTSTQIQIVNGSFSKQAGHTYVIQPLKPGIYTIGPASISASGRTYSSGTAVLTVTGQLNAPSASAREQIFLSASIAPKEAYPEQQIVYTLRLFFRQKIGNVSVDLPKAEGITFSQLGDSRQYATAANGQNYQVLEVRYQLQPSKPGLYQLGPARMQMTVYGASKRSRSDFFDDDFFGTVRGSQRTFASEPLSLSVNRLPESGRPAGFTGLTGKFSMESRLEPSSVKAGDSATLTVQISGQGNANRIPDIAMPDIPGLKVYPDKPVLETATGAQGVSGTKTMKWALVPQQPGTYTIPQLGVSYFDTVQKKYASMATAPHTLNASQSEQSAVSAPAGPVQQAQPKAEVRTLATDILPAHTSISELSPGFDVRHNILAVTFILGLPVLAWLAVLIFTKLRNVSIEQTDAIRAKRASKEFAALCRKGRLTSSQMLDALRVYMNSRFRLSAGLLTPDEADRILSENGVKEETAARLKKVLGVLQQEIYTGRGDAQALLDEDMPELISRIDREAR